LKDLPTKGLKPEQIQHMKQRKKCLIKTMKEMDILDFRPSGNHKGGDDEFDDGMNGGGGKRENKRKNKNRNNAFYPENLPADFDEL